MSYFGVWTFHRPDGYSLGFH